MRPLFLICVLCFFLSGCVGTKIHTMPVQKYSASFDVVWNSILDYLNNGKEPIMLADKDKGTIVTDWVIMEKVFATKRYRYEIQVKDLENNFIQVAIASPQEAYSMGDWDKMLPTERRAQAIFRAIRWDVKKAPGAVVTIISRPFIKRQWRLERNG